MDPSRGSTCGGVDRSLDMAATGRRSTRDRARACAGGGSTTPRRGRSESKSGKKYPSRAERRVARRGEQTFPFVWALSSRGFVYRTKFVLLGRSCPRNLPGRLTLTWTEVFFGHSDTRRRARATRDPPRAHASPQTADATPRRVARPRANRTEPRRAARARGRRSRLIIKDGQRAAREVSPRDDGTRPRVDASSTRQRDARARVVA